VTNLCRSGDQQGQPQDFPSTFPELNQAESAVDDKGFPSGRGPGDAFIDQELQHRVFDSAWIRVDGEASVFFR